MHSPWWKILRGVVAAVAAVLVYLVLIPQTSVDRGLLGRLVVAHTADREVPKTAAVDQKLPGSRSTFAPTKDAARKHPDETGLVAREWYVSASAPPEAGIVAQLLPDAATATRVYDQGLTQLSKPPQLSGATTGTAAPFALPGVPTGKGVAFPLSDSTSASATPTGVAYQTLYRVGRVVVSELMVSTSPAVDTSPAVLDAQAGHALLLQREPGFTLVRHHTPVVASIVFWVVAVVVVAAAVFVPGLVMTLRTRRRTKRVAREEHRAREQYLARGRRAVKRQRAPQWAQGRRR